MQANIEVNMTPEAVPHQAAAEMEDVPRSTGQAALPEDDSCQQDQTLNGMDVEANAAVLEGSGMAEPEEAGEQPQMDSAEVDQEQTPQRTESQRVKALKVEKVCEDVNSLRQPVADLNRSTSEMCGADTSRLENADVQTLQEELELVDQAQKKARNFGEDLVERMLALDNLSNLAKGDRAARKVAIQGIEGLLQQVDTTKARLQSMKRDMEQQIEKRREVEAQQKPTLQKQAGSNFSSHSPEQQHLPQTGTSSSHPSQAEPKRGVNASPPFPPVEAWKGLKLPVQFHAAEEQGRYVIQANILGLDPSAVEARLDEHSDTLTIRGFRAPTEAEAELMVDTLFSKLARSPYVRQLLQKNSVEACLKLGVGKYGSFSQTFAVPADVRADRISLDCVDGVLQVQLPKRRTMPYSARARPMSFHAPVGSYYADPWQRRRAPMPGLFGSFGGVY
mmetsp:Transcript_23450/g.43199  ORF Transcript_23450/g.43199 Transcript_23450/m.43199 type:complete len:448 (+) Transcript_23450:77-1420(+)